MIYTYSISSFLRFVNAWSWINWRRFSFSNLKCKLKAEVLSVEDLDLRKKGGGHEKAKGGRVEAEALCRVFLLRQKSFILYTMPFLPDVVRPGHVTIASTYEYT